MGRFFPRLNDTVMTTKKTLQINLKTIPETGLPVAIDLGPEWFGRWHEEDPGLEFADARITGLVHLSKHGHDLLVRGSLSGQMELACSRCLESFAAPAAIDFDLLLAPRPPTAPAEDGELSLTDLDLDYYTGEIVDLESLLREQIILMMPLKPLCNETCNGLCPQCGANLNFATCVCKTDDVNSPFAQLAKLKT
ncbi:MAG: DUF177 domain-containing protein [Deltaproteobacteria bacterium]|nr:DUF177 domain-containing protein [Deltaproteobacteria bacterium]